MGQITVGLKTVRSCAAEDAEGAEGADGAEGAEDKNGSPSKRKKSNTNTGKTRLRSLTGTLFNIVANRPEGVAPNNFKTM